MKKILIDFDLSGWSYDPNNPTRDSEKLCFVLYQILDNLKTAGFSITQAEAADFVEAEAQNSTFFDQIKAKLGIDFPAIPENEKLESGKLYDALNESRASFINSLALCQRLDTSTSIGWLIESILRAMLNQESVVYLSDGTPIFCRSGLL